MNDQTIITVPQPIDNLPATVQTVGDLYRENSGRTARAMAATSVWLSKVKDFDPGNMPRELYDEGVTLLSQLSKTKTYMEQQRKPLTQAFDAVRAEFTAKENELDEKKSGSQAAVVKNKLDAYAAAEYRRREEERLKTLAIAQFKADAVRHVSHLAIESALEDYRALLSELEAAKTKKQIDSVAEKLRQALNVVPNKILITDEMIVAVKSPALPSPQDRISAWSECNLSEEILTYAPLRARADAINGLISRIPNYVAAVTSKSEAKKEAAQQEIDRAQQEEQARQLALEESAEATAAEAGRQHMVATNAVKLNGPKVKKSYRVVVLDNKAYMNLLALYLEYDGAELNPEELGKKSLAQLTTFAASHFMATGEKIESAGLLYEEVIETKKRR